MEETGSPTSRRSVLKLLGIGAASAVGVPTALQYASTPARAVPEVSKDAWFHDDSVTIDSFDGTTLHATLYEPTEEGPHPAILSTHGWGGNRGDNSDLGKYYAANGYAVLTYDSRGFGESEGKVASTSEQHRKDASRLIDWFANEGNDRIDGGIKTDGENNPRIGMDGSSYGGGIQFRTAAEDDRLDAIIPRITWYDLSYSLAPNNVLKWGWYKPLTDAVVDREIDPHHQEISNSILEDKEMDERAREYYQTRSPITYLDEVTTPTLIIHGWHDRLFFPNEALANFRGLQDNNVESSLIIDNGGHFFGNAAETDTQEQFVWDAALAWMNAFLKEDDGNHGVSPVNLYDASENEFETAEEFPPADVDEETYRLADGKRQQWKIQLRDEPDPDREVVSIDFPLSEASELLGTPKLSLRVVPTGDTMNLVVGLEKVSDGTASLINEQITAVEVEKPTQVEVELPTVHEVFDEDDSLRLSITTRDTHLTDVFYPYMSEPKFYVRGDAPSEAILQDTPGHPAELTLPLR